MVQKLIDDENLLKLAVFAVNVSGGTAVTNAPGRLKVTWQESCEIAQKADRLGFDAIIPVARWKGFEGPIKQNDRNFETMTWAAGIASVTKHIQVFATVHVPTVHPVRMAKEIVTIDHISSGRAGLNIVAGWNEVDLAMFGGMPDHTQRYRMSDEWITLAKRIWSEDTFDFNGEFYSVPGAHGEPKPIQTPHPVLMSAGSSPTGRDFAARHTDVIFILYEGLEKTREAVRDIKRHAKEHYGRNVRVMTTSFMVCKDSDGEAREYLDFAINEMGDMETARLMAAAWLRNSKSSQGKADIETMAKKNMIGSSAIELVGSPQTIADQLVEVQATGLDGITCTWLDYMEGLSMYEKKLYSLLQERGIRS